MGALLSRHRKSDDELFEKELEDLDLCIRELKLTIQERKTRSRQIQFFILLFSLVIFAVLLFCCFLDLKLAIQWARWPAMPHRKLLYALLATTMAEPEAISTLQAFSKSKAAHFFDWLYLLSAFSTFMYLGVFKGFKFMTSRSIEGMEGKLKLTLSKQKCKLEELKKKTKFYLMKDLVERYETMDPNSPTTGLLSAGRKKKSTNIVPSLGHAIPPVNDLNSKKLSNVPSHGLSQSSQSDSMNPFQDAKGFIGHGPQSSSSNPSFGNISPIMPSHYPRTMTNNPTSVVTNNNFNNQVDQKIPQTIPRPPLTRTWMDRLLDAVLGDDGKSQTGGISDSNGPNGQYKASHQSTHALICRICGNHNGLVFEKDYISLQYSCPKCHQWNGPLIQPHSHSQSAPPCFDIKKEQPEVHEEAGSLDDTDLLIAAVLDAEQKKSDMISSPDNSSGNIGHSPELSPLAKSIDNSSSLDKHSMSPKTPSSPTSNLASQKSTQLNPTKRNSDKKKKSKSTLTPNK